MEEIIIKKCTNQELSQSERLKLDAWLNESPKNRQIYTQLELTLLDPGAKRRAEVREEVWSNLKNRIAPATGPAPIPMKAFGFWYKVAAVLTVFCSLSILIYNTNLMQFGNERNIVEVKVIEKVSLPGQKITTTLPDGTMVVLNAESKLIVPENFTDNLREVILQGEAFFDVARDEQRPFIIRAQNLQVEVLGTSFNVRSYPDEDVSVVAVATGKVAVTHNANRERLAPGDKLAFSSSTGSLTRSSFDPDEEYGWKDNILHIRGENLTQIVETLKRWYGVEFAIKNEHIELEKKFSGKYQDPSLRAVMEGLSFVYDFSYQIEGKQVIIK